MKTSSTALALAIMAATSTAYVHDRQYEHEKHAAVTAMKMKGSSIDGKQMLNEASRQNLRSLKKKKVASDYSWLVGTYDSGTMSWLSLNEGVGVMKGEDVPGNAELDIAAFQGTTTNRIFQAHLTFQAHPCKLLGLTEDECPETSISPNPVVGNQTTAIMYEFEGVGSYASQQADQMVFVTDHFKYLKVVNGTNVWVDSFSADTDEIDVMTCFRMKGDEQLPCDFRLQFVLAEGVTGPNLLGPHFQSVGSVLWEESEE
mmetsp:Transcript_15514/g.23082  ORF Transcript_15514/g.23082 Transcript_15514/m.23082 type:complete len:258 (+) Transcript_15514:934-1707(+)